MLAEVITLDTVIYSSAAFFAISYFREFTNQFREVSKSIKELNEKIAVIIERTENHSTEISLIRKDQKDMLEDISRIKAHISPNDR